MRTLLRSRGFAAAVILILGVAIALQSSMVAVVSAYILRGLPYPDAERLHSITYAQPPASPPDGLEDLDWASLSDVIEHPIAWDLDMFYLLGGEYPESAPGAWVTWGFMQGLGIRAAIGRAFTPADFQAGQPQVALISHSLWRDRYGSDPNILGRTFSAYVSDRPDDPETFTIVGVLPEGFWHLNPYTQVLTPLRANTYPYLVRLQPGVSPDQAKQRVNRLARDANLNLEGWRVDVRATNSEYTRAARPMLLAVGAAVTIVFLIACANVGLLMVLRGMRRRKELAVRMALGANLGRVARHLLTESLALVAAATLFGLTLAWWVLRTFGTSIEQQLNRRVPGGTPALALDWRVLTIIGGTLLVVAVVLSLAPLVGGRHSFALLRDRRVTSQGGGRHTRSLLIAVEVGGSLALLVGCGLMARTVVRLLDVDTGMQLAGLVSAPLAIRQQSYPDPASRATMYERLLVALRSGTGARVALSGPSPLAMYNPEPVTTMSDSGLVTVRASARLVSDGYFEAIGVPILRGRPVVATDGPGAEPVAVVSESAARRMWGERNPIGQRVRVIERPTQRDSVVVERTVVGVARDVRQSPTDDLLVDLYVPLTQNPGRFVSVVARASGAPQWWSALRRTVTSVDDEIAVGTVQRLDELMDRQLARPRFLATLFTAFGIFAATLGAVGLYVVIAYAVKSREHEIAVRMAVGATGRRIVRMVLREGSLVVGAGLALGVAGAFAVGRLLRSQLFGVGALDPATLLAATTMLAAVSVLAIWWPARRASRTNPVIALKSE